MKAIAIVELPDDADLTKLRANINIEKVRDCGYDYEPFTFRLYCPLRPLPDSKKVIVSGKGKVVNYLYANGFVDGFNACLDEITDHIDEANELVGETE